MKELEFLFSHGLTIVAQPDGKVQVYRFNESRFHLIMAAESLTQALEKIHGLEIFA